MEPSSNKRTKLVNIMLLMALLVFCSNSAYESELKEDDINKQQETTQEESEQELLESKESEEKLLTIRENSQEDLEDRRKKLELSKRKEREKELSKSEESKSKKTEAEEIAPELFELELFEREEAMEYTEQELELLATVMYAEAGGCDDAELYRVANVVINRVNNESNIFENTIEEVIYQSGQFSSVGGEAWNRGPSEREFEIAKDVLEGRRIFPEGVVWFAKKHMYGEVYDTPSKWHVYSSL